MKQTALGSTHYSFGDSLIQIFKFGSFHFDVVLQIGVKISIKLMYKLILAAASRRIGFSATDGYRFAIGFGPS